MSTADQITIALWLITFGIILQEPMTKFFNSLKDVIRQVIDGIISGALWVARSAKDRMAG